MDRAEDGAGAERPRRIVVKVGSAVVAPGGEVDARAVARLCDDLAAARAGGTAAVLVSSGAVASGFRSLGLAGMPRAVRAKQAAAAVGQPRLMGLYAQECARHGITTGQVLLTGEDFHDRARFLNARHTLETLLAAGVLPIVNENDSVSFDEIRLGDNDRLSALTAGMVGADLLVVLSSVPGLLDGHGRVVPEVMDLSHARSLVSGGGSAVGTGGFATKLDAVGIARSHGVPAVVAAGPSDAEPAPIGRVLSGRGIGTKFPVPRPARSGERAPARKSWIVHAARVGGVVTVDDGAARALVRRGASLLPGGVVRVEGSFVAGAAVEVRTRLGVPIARGLASYGSAELEKITGGSSAEIERRLGYFYSEEVIHRDDLALLDDAVAAVEALDGGQGGSIGPRGGEGLGGGV